MNNTKTKRQEAKLTAAMILADSLSVARGYWVEQEKGCGVHYTDEQKELINQEMKKLADRMAKIAGYVGSWVS